MEIGAVVEAAAGDQAGVLAGVFDGEDVVEAEEALLSEEEDEAEEDEDDDAAVVDDDSLEDFSLELELDASVLLALPDSRLSLR